MGLRNNPSKALETIAEADLLYNSQIQYYLSNAPDLVKKVTIKLDDLRDQGSALELGFAFQSVYVQSATDSATAINIIPYGQNGNNNEFPLRLKDVLNFDIPIAKCDITNIAQAGKEVTLLFLLRGRFDSGSQLSEVKSSVDGNSVSVESPVTVTTVAALLIAQDLNRTTINLYCSAQIWISGSTTSSNWYPLPAGYTKIKNTAAIYAKTTAGFSTVRILVEK